MTTFATKLNTAPTTLRNDSEVLQATTSAVTKAPITKTILIIGLAAMTALNQEQFYL